MVVLWFNLRVCHCKVRPDDAIKIKMMCLDGAHDEMRPIFVLKELVVCTVL